MQYTAILFNMVYDKKTVGYAIRTLMQYQMVAWRELPWGIKVDALVKSRISDGFVKSSQARRANPEE